MAQKKNRKKKPKRRKKKADKSSLAKTIAAAFVLGVLSAFGLWHCFDEDSGSPLDPFEEKKPARVVKVVKERSSDPTLLREKKLLEAEMPAKKKKAKAKEKPKEKLPPEKEEDLKARFKMHAVAFHFHTQIRKEPSSEAMVIGYARRGATFMVSERVGRKGCQKGWHEIAPGGLFICSGKGVIISDEPVTFAPSPPSPNLGSPLPYRYAYVTSDNTPQYWRTPTDNESQNVLALFDRIAAAQQTGRDAGGRDAGIAPKLPPLPDGGTPDPYALPQFVHLRMARGYYVSIDDDVTDNKTNTTFQRTIRGRFVQADKLAQAKPSSFEGTLFSPKSTLPLVYVVGGGVKLLRQREEGARFKTDKLIKRLTKLPFLGAIKRRGKRYVQVGEDLFLNSRVAAVIRKVEPPENLNPSERWIDINLSEQTLVAYEGETPVFATLVSTGREGFETPEGSFRIYSKHFTITMDDPEAGEEAYSIEDVPWTQYFEESYALHAAFWHNRFGRVRSHGCINLSPADARRLFFWTGPHLPDGIHGIVATRENPGTRVIIHM